MRTIQIKVSNDIHEKVLLVSENDYKFKKVDYLLPGGKLNLSALYRRIIEAGLRALLEDV